MATKRSIDHDPDYEDYEDVSDRQTKRQKVLEQDGKDATIKKIEDIVRHEFEKEIDFKEQEIDIIDQRLHQARTLLDRLRACIVAKYYSNSTPSSQASSSSSSTAVLHPAVKKMVGKRPKAEYVHPALTDSAAKKESLQQRSKDCPPAIEHLTKQDKEEHTDSATAVNEDFKRVSRFKVKKKIIVGNVSKYIPHDKRDENDQATHKWMVYVRGSKAEPNIDGYVKKVWFFLHPSYRPNDLVVISQSPFHLCRRGWGEFPVRVQLHFRDPRNKRVDIIHNLKLDRTYTGLQTLGAETTVDIELEKDSLPSTAHVKDLVLKKENCHSIQNTGENPLARLHNGYVQTPFDKKTCQSNHAPNHQMSMDDHQQVAGTCQGLETQLKHELHEAVSSSTGGDSRSCAVNVEAVNTGGVVSSSAVSSTSTGNVDKLQVEPRFSLEHGPGRSVGSVNHVSLGLKKEPTNVNLRESQESRNAANAGKILSTNTHGELLRNIKQEPMDTSFVAANHAISKAAQPLQFKRSEKSASTSVAGKPLLSFGQTNGRMPLLQPNTTYVRCVDNSGKIYLVPHHLIPKLVDSGNIQKSGATELLSKSLLATPGANSGTAVAPTATLVRPSMSVGQTSKVVGEQNLIKTNKSKSLLNLGIATGTSTATDKRSFAVGAATISKIGTCPTSANTAAKLFQNSANTAAKSLQNSAQFVVNSKSPSSSKYVIIRTSTPGSNTGVTKPYLLAQIPATPVVETSNNSNKLTQAKAEHSLLKSSGASTTSEQLIYTLRDGVLRPSFPSTVARPSLSTDFVRKRDLSAGEYLKKLKSFKKSVLDSEVEDHLVNCLPDFGSVESLVKAVVKRLPLIKPGVDRSIHPYCVASEEEFHKWKTGKKRASEWLRARAVGQCIRHLLDKGGNPKQLQIWSTKRTMTWCQRNGYTPLDKGWLHSMRLKATNQAVMPTTSSFTSNLDMLKAVENQQRELVTVRDDGDLDIDIISLEDTTKPELKQELSPLKSPVSSQQHLPPSEGAVCVQEIAQQIGVKLKPHQIEPSIFCPLVEEILWSATCQMADDIVRAAVAGKCEREGFPSELNVADIYQGITSLDNMNFLTNSGLGKMEHGHE